MPEPSSSVDQSERCLRAIDTAIPGAIPEPSPSACLGSLWSKGWRGGSIGELRLILSVLEDAPRTLLVGPASHKDASPLGPHSRISRARTRGATRESRSTRG